MMGGFFGVAAKKDCVFDLFFGVDYHSHLGTRRAGMAVYDQEKGFDRAIHNIENAPFPITGPMPSPRWDASTIPRSWCRKSTAKGTPIFWR